MLIGAWLGASVRTRATSRVVCVRTTDRSVHPWPGIATCVEPWDPLGSQLLLLEFHNGAVTEVFSTACHQIFQTKLFRFKKLRLTYLNKNNFEFLGHWWGQARESWKAFNESSSIIPNCRSTSTRGANEDKTSPVALQSSTCKPGKVSDFSVYTQDNIEAEWIQISSFRL